MLMNMCLPNFDIYQYPYFFQKKKKKISLTSGLKFNLSDNLRLVLGIALYQYKKRVEK